MVKLRDPRWGYMILFILMFTLCTIPVSSPIPILKWTKDLYDYVEALPPRTLILYSNQYGSPGPTFEPFAHAFLYQAMQKDLRVVVVSPSLIFVPWADRLLGETGWKAQKEYGVDYVNLGFLPGAEAGIATLAKDVSAVFKVDYFGNPVNSLPIMDDFKNANDIAILIIVYDYDPQPSAWIRQWRPYGVPIGLAHYASPSMWLPYYYSGDLIGISSDSDGGAQYETLVGKPGLATALATLQSTLFILQAGVIVAASIAYWGTKLSKKEVT